MDIKERERNRSLVYKEYGVIHKSLTNILEEHICKYFNSYYFCENGNESNPIYCNPDCPFYREGLKVHHPAYCAKIIARNVFAVRLLEKYKDELKPIEQ